MGTRSVEAMPPRIPAVFITPETAPACSPARYTAAVQKPVSAKKSEPTLTHKAATATVLLFACAAAYSKMPDTPYPRMITHRAPDNRVPRTESRSQTTPPSGANATAVSHGRLDTHPPLSILKPRTSTR